jgi:hypothetical protein
MVEQYLKTPNDENAQVLFDVLTEIQDFSSLNDIESRRYPQAILGCVDEGKISYATPTVIGGDFCYWEYERENNLGMIFDDRRKFLKYAAANKLWDNHACFYASRIIELIESLPGDSVENLPDDSDDAVEWKEIAVMCKENVQKDLKPEEILKVLQNKKCHILYWYAWLAALRPNPMYTPALLKLADADAPLPEVVYALGQSRDARALPVLLAILKKKENKDDRLCCIAADAIGLLGDSSVEPQLLTALENNHANNPKAKICEALGKVGTMKSLPALQNIKTAKNYKTLASRDFDVASAARDAITAIKRRAVGDKK